MASVDPEDLMDSCGDAIEMAESRQLATEDRCKTLKQENTDLYELLEKADNEMLGLFDEVTSVREQNNSLQRQIAQLQDLMEEVDNLKHRLEQSMEAEFTAEQQRKDLERRCLQVENRAEELSNQISDCNFENKLLYEDVTRMRLLVAELQTSLQKKTLELKEKEDLLQKRDSVMEEMNLTVNEYSSIIEVLNNKIRALQSQLEETCQEIALRKNMEQTSVISPDPAVSGTLMYEMVQVKLEKELLKNHLDKERQKKRGFLGLRLLFNMLLQLLWCYFITFVSTGFFLLFVYYLLQVIKIMNPNFQGLNLRCFLSPQTVDMIQEVLRPYLVLEGPGVVPS
ncbi:uncharacterized protein LOC142140042 [Mixophyes fleayi]|uniref:uncharacterized protein LOC142140042 n=1 Tax=Mixophyes fleayi TaxID=3061075 RepID=UPI003F4DE6A6